MTFSSRSSSTKPIQSRTTRSKFKMHFVKRRNTIYERAKFNSRKQEQGEAVDDFIVDLYALAEPCQYSNLREEMIRDRIVVGIRDGRLAEKLQLDSGLMLEKAVTGARQSEAVKKQQSTVREGNAGQPAGAGVSEVRRQKQRYRPKHEDQAKPSATGPSCPRCGKSPLHPKLKCPAREATCSNCRKKGHYQSVCRSKKLPWPAKVRSVRNEDDDEDEEDDVFMGTIQSNVDSTKAKEKSTANLKKAGQDNHTTQEIFVVRGLKKPLLGLPAIKALGVVAMVEQVHSENITKNCSQA